MPDRSQSSRVIKEVGGHTLLVTVVFLIIFAAAIGLDQLLKWLIRIGILETGSAFVLIIVGATYMLLGIDGVFFVAVVLILTWRSLKEIYYARSRNG